MYIISFDYMVIITSAIFGSYGLIRGITMYTGGYVNEFTLFLASQNGDITEVKWTMYVYWALMIIMAFGSINAQLSDRNQHLEAYTYKKNQHAQFENYRSMRERISRMGGARDEYPSDYSA